MSCFIDSNIRENINGPVLCWLVMLGEPSAPKLEARFHNRGNSFKVNWIKQDDGGLPIKHYLVRYKAKKGSEWKPEIRVPQNSDYVLLSGLEWNTDYEVYVVAENQYGKSQPGTLSFRTSAEPTSVPGVRWAGRCPPRGLSVFLFPVCPSEVYHVGLPLHPHMPKI
ncbi:Neural cell adhesion molecule 1 [Takifugu flavidus]|uniref:Neural cell adhesion molecule 1 n=1 Tax=Takifugu flavidus TaxID=433684 RepID=A0A5C6P5T8_9TELE|nr:Neural cell adhesion molecule 1 [Takifugu flavidus]